MRDMDCNECRQLWAHYERAVLNHNAAIAEFEAASHDSDTHRQARARDRMQETEKDRIEARQELLTHEKTSHPSREPSFT